MRKFIVLALVAAFVVAAVPTTAQAFPYLAPGEASRAVGQRLHSEWNNIRTGTLRSRCYMARYPSLRRCAYSYRSDYGDRWCGTMSVRETATSYITRILSDNRC